jgi:hypothetical protein
MKIFLIISFCFAAFYSSAQSGKNKKPKPLRINASKPIATQPKKEAYVIVTSDEKITSGDEWENQWTKYIEDESRKVAMKVLQADSAKRVYKVMLRFSVKEDGKVSNLSVTCDPGNDFIVNECRQMAINAPKKKSTTGNYVKMSIQQPVDIKVK